MDVLDSNGPQTSKAEESEYDLMRSAPGITITGIRDKTASVSLKKK